MRLQSAVDPESLLGVPASGAQVLLSVELRLGTQPMDNRLDVFGEVGD